MQQERLLRALVKAAEDEAQHLQARKGEAGAGDEADVKGWAENAVRREVDDD